MGEEIVRLLKDGKTYDEICRSVGCAKGTVSYHAKRSGLSRQYQKPKSNMTHFDWNAVQSYHDLGHSASECRDKFGFSRSAWFKASFYGRISPHDLRKMIPIENLLARRYPTSRHHLKNRLFGILEQSCKVCHITEWLGKKISLHLDHINGNNSDNRIENLRLLCPNCHSQTDTYGGRNRGKVHSDLR